MTYLVEIPVDSGGRLLVQASGEVPSGLELASSRTGTVVAKAQQSLERALDQIAPAIRAVHRQIAAMAPSSATIEFGLVLGAETGIVVAKGSSEVHVTVTMSWQRPDPGDQPANSDHAGQ